MQQNGNENEIVYLHLDDIIPNRFQPRQVFDEKALKELAVSIKEHGVIQPIIVRNIGNKYEIIAGERRYKASALAGLTKIPAIIRNLDDKESSKVALLENLQRKNLNPIEEAKTYQKILELDQMTQEELAKTMGKSQSAVANKLRLLTLTDEVQDALLKEQISERHARALLSVSDKERQKQLLKEVIAKKMTVRELEDIIKPSMPKENSNSTSPNLATSSGFSPVIEEKNQSPISDNSIIPDIAPVNSNNNFNQSIGIDYSTPPKFIDYGIDDDNTEKVTDSTLTSSAATPIDINQLRAQAQDINVEKPKVDMESLLKVDKKEEPQEFVQPNSGFKFFGPMDDQEDSNKENIPMSSSAMSLGSQVSSDLEKNQTSSSTNNHSNNNDLNKMFESTPVPTMNAEATSMDNLLSGINNSSSEPKVPALDTFNNPFARNPIFSDDVAKLENSKAEEAQERPKYTFNESLDLIRDDVKAIEQSGFKVDIEEINFEKNYQIVIKILKDGNEAK